MLKGSGSLRSLFMGSRVPCVQEYQHLTVFHVQRFKGFWHLKSLNQYCGFETGMQIYA